MVKLNINKDELVRAVKRKQKPKKANFTFRLDDELMKLFRKQCDNRDVTATEVIEEFLRAFTESKS